MLNSPLAIGMPGPFEMMIIGVIMLLLFGNRLPSLMRSLGRGVIEFKKGVHGIEDELESSIENTPSKDDDAPPKDNDD
jgi:sec-independent protein translocase protein TatA